MKKTITFFSLLLFFNANAQVFNGYGGGILNLGQNTYFNLPVSGVNPSQLDSTFGIEQIGINIDHPEVEELSISLKSPSGTIVELSKGSSLSGTNYSNTYLNSQANTSITTATAPFTGTYKPIGYLGRFNSAQAANGVWQLIVHDAFAHVDSGYVISWSIQFGNNPAPPVDFISSNLPIVKINTYNQTISDSKIMVGMGIIDNGPNRNYLSDPFNNYNAKATINFRGSSSKNFEKKPYAIETKDANGYDLNAPILGMPTENDWDLLAEYQDKSLMRTSFTFDLYRKMGHYASRFKNVELILNNEYQGIYTVVEKLKRDHSRIDISKLTPQENSSPDITGGYIFKIDRPDEPGWTSLLPGDSTINSHFFYQYVYPKDTAITIQQQAYIKNFVGDFETSVASSSFADPVNGYRKYIDEESFIDFFIISELSKNVDAYRLSTYLFKDNINIDGKLHIGPVWDYNLAWHNCDYGNANYSSGWEYQLQDPDFPTPMWWQRFMQDSNFVNNLYCRWTELRQNILDINNMNTYIDSSANFLNESQARNFTQWPILGAYIRPNPQNQAGASYQNEVTDLKNWITSRVGWMDAAITGSCISAGIEETSIDNSVTVSPNPFQSTTTFSIGLIEDADVTLKIVDAMGRELPLLVNEHRHSGEFKIIFDRQQIAAGIYFYQLRINNTMKTGKIIIQ